MPPDEAASLRRRLVQRMREESLDGTTDAETAAAAEGEAG